MRHDSDTKKYATISAGYPRWNQHVDGHVYPVVDVPEDDAFAWADALTRAAYLGLRWVVRRGSWLVGCERGCPAPSFAGIDRPDWTYESE